MRNDFEKQLNELNGNMILMAAQCENCIAEAVQALLTGDETHVEKAHNYEKETDNSERNIQDMCLKLILEQQPVAGDLRNISAALKMITDLERIGDQGSDIADLIKFIKTEDNRKYSRHITKMADAVIAMLNDAITSYVQKDADLARSIYRKDDEVDSLFLKVKNDILKMITEEKKYSKTDGENMIDALMIAKYFERIGDHTVNLSEWVLFSMGEEKK